MQTPAASSDTRTTLDSLPEVKSQYQLDKEEIVNHHVAVQKVILETSKQCIEAKYDDVP